MRQPYSKLMAQQFKWLLLLPLFLAASYQAQAQITLATGDVAFTGYNCAGGGLTGQYNEFSFIILRTGGIPAGTVINITDNGYNNSTAAFTTNEGIITWTATVALPQFTQVKIKIAQDAVTVQTVTSGSASVTGFFSMSGAGDQLFAYQGMLASNPTLLAGIHMNSEVGNGPSNPSSYANWDHIVSGGWAMTGSRSAIPPGLTNGVNAVMAVPQPGVADSEDDNGVYNCTGSSAATLSAIRTSINTPAHWTLQEVTNLTIPPACTFSVGTPPTITNNPPNRTICTGANTTFPVGANNATAYQWQVNTGSGFTNITNGAPYSGATTATLTVTGATFGMNGYLYRVVVTGTAGSVNSNSGTLTVINITTSGAQSNVSCFGGSNGAMAVNASGGITPYTYDWSPSGGTGSLASGRPAGNYMVTVTDAIGCTTTRNFTLTQPSSPVSGSTTVTNLACNGNTNGIIDLTPAGGTPGYTYVWSDGPTTQDRTGLSAGTYSVIITDANACQKTINNIAVSQPASPVSGTAIVTDVSCNGGNNGTIDITPSGGTAPYTYHWGGGITTQDRTGLTAGTYSVTITDNNACTHTINNIVVGQSASSITATTVVTNVSCNGGSNGAINLTVSGGATPYTFDWGGGITTEDRTGLTAGNYSVTIADANGCSETISVSVGQPASAVSGSTVVTNVACNGNGNGAINLTPTGGTGPYTYNWVGGTTTEDRTGLVAGTYTVTITDNNGCTGTVSATVTEPAAISVSLSPAAASVCSGSSVNLAVNPSALAFDGTGQHVSLPAFSFNSDGDDITIEFWANINSSDVGNRTLFDFPTADGMRVLAHMPWGDNLLYWDYGNIAGNGRISTNYSAYLNKWTHVALVSEGKNGTFKGIYLDGILVASSGVSDGANTLGSTGLDLGTTGIGSSYKGSLDEFRVWNQVRSASQIQSNMNSSLLAPATGLVLNLPFSEASGTTVLDLSSNGISGTLTSGSGGVPPARVPGFDGSQYTYTWSPATGLSATTGAMVTASPTSTTIYTVTAAYGTCPGTTTNTVTVTVNDVPQVTVSETNASCSSSADGTATASATAGTSPYTYLWSNGATTATATGLTAGTHTVTVTDANGCSVQETATIGVNPVASDPSVFGNGVWNVYAWNSGDATDVGNSWNQNYSGYYTDSTLNLNTQNQWNSNGSPSGAAGYQGCPVGADNHSFSAKRTGFTCGYYSISIPDHDDEAELWIDGVMVWQHVGCCDSHTSVWSGFLTTSSQVEFRVTEGGGGSNGSIQFSSQTASITGLQNICAGGTVALTALPAGVDYLWSNGATTQNITVSAAGTYSVTVTGTSAPGCSLTASHIVTEVVATASGTSICSGETASLTATGADTYAWYDASAGGNLLGTGATFTTPALTDTTTYYVEGLTGGINNLATTMAGGNGASGNMFDLTTQASAVSITSFDINTYNIGIPVTVEVYYKTGSYSGSQNTPANWTLHSSTTVNGLGFGNYTNIPIPALTLSANQTYGLYVTTTDGSISYTDGVNTYSDSYLTFASGNGNSYPFQSDFFPRTFNGRINYSVGDCAGPRQPVTVAVTEPATLSVLSANITCNGATDGTATVSATGSAPFTYSWNTSPAQTTASASGLTAGTYTVTVTDDNGCTSTATATITEPSVLTASITSQTNIACNGGSTGSATVTATGGTGSYTYSWTNGGGTAATASGLAAGTYTVTVIDTNGCTETASVTITQPTVVVASISSITNVSCYGGNNGFATASAAGGTGTFFYSWNTVPVQTTATATGLSAGTYTVTVTDANGCADTETVTITAPSSSVAGTIVVTNVSCNGGSNGTINLTATGGAAPYTYIWGGSITTEDRTGLAAGTYSVTITDANGCTGTASATITQPAVLLASITSSTNLACNGGSTGSATVTASGGVGPYAYNWSNGATSATAAGLTAGTYTVTITDANGCASAQQSVTITQPATLIASISASTDISCNGGSNGSATVTANGGASGYTYLWSNGATTATATGLTADVYTVVVTDANGCTSAQQTVTIIQPAALTASATATDVTTIGGTNGTATVTVTGGTSAYTYSWNTTPGQITASATGLSSGSYTVTVTDANGCTTTAVATVGFPSCAITLSASQTNVSCFGASTGSAIVTLTNGAAPITYSWSNGTSAATATGLAAGIYTVTVTDANGCSETASVNITQPASAVSVAITSTANLSCFGGNSGSATASATGGTGPYTYNWNTSPVQTSAMATGLTVGTYTVTVTDANGCQDTETVTITEPVSALSASVTAQTPASCNGTATGSATVTALGGTMPYSYSWNTSPVQTTATATDLAANTYTVTVTDANGCETTTTVNITNQLISGVFTVDPSQSTAGTNFNSFSDLASALNTCGIAGPTTINVLANTGPYTDQLILNQIPGASASNTVIINGNNNVINHCSTTPANRDMIRLNGTDHVTINGFVLNATCSQGWGVHVMGDVENVTISNNTIHLSPQYSGYVGNMNGIIVGNSFTDPAAMSGATSGLTIAGNTINSGYHGIRINGNTTNVASNVSISNNILNAPKVFGLFMSYGDNVSVDQNQVLMFNAPAGTVLSSMGIYLVSLENLASVQRNKITNAGHMGMWLNYVNRTSTARGMVANNMIGGGFRNSTTYGVQLNSASNLDLYYNSINVDFGATGVGLYVSNLLSSELTLVNNSIAYTGSGANGRALHAGDAFENFTAIDYNNYYSTSNYFVYFNRGFRTNLAALQASVNNGFVHDMNSWQLDPMYTGNTNLELQATSQLVNKALPLANVLVDYSGSTRTATPTIGADEIVTGSPRLAQQLEVNVYPNPFRDELKVDVTGMNGAVELTLVDMMGRQVYSRTFDASAGVLTLQPQVQLAQGVYLLQIGNNGSVTQTRVVKQ